MARPRKAIAALCFCLAATAGFPAAPAVGYAEPVDQTVSRLARVGVFAFGGIGFTGAISQGENGFVAIAARPSAEADFEKLFAIGTPEAKCYALTGILRLNPATFKALTLSPAFAKSSATKVTTMQGCIMSGHTLHDVVESIRAGIYAR
jgi:hypothetical protein